MARSAVLVDSSAIISHFRRPEASLLLCAADQFDEIKLSVISEFEVDLGARIAGRLSDIERVLPEIVVLPSDRKTIANAIDIALELRRKRRSIEMEDLLVAATAREWGLPLLTENEKHFQGISGVELVSL
jgi:predicted nucleic acid-binding protein